MDTYRFDGSFEGFLTLVFQLWRQPDHSVEIVIDDPGRLDFGDDGFYIPPDADQAHRVRVGILKKLGKPLLNEILAAFLSGRSGIYTALFIFIRYAFQIGPAALHHLTRPEVQAVALSSRSVNREVHRFLGLLRFQELKDGTFYSAINPAYPILPLIADHFLTRFNDQDWVIHDTIRHFGLLYLNGAVRYESAFHFSHRDLDSMLSDTEHKLQEIWREYHRRIAIEERQNLKLQKQFIPQRYWSHLVEMKVS